MAGGLSVGLKLAVFDVDGTLSDSRQVIAQAMATAFAGVGLPDPGYDRTRRIVGLSLHEAVARLAPEDLSAPLLDRLVEGYKRAFVTQREADGFSEPLYAGALDTVERLAETGWLIGLATGKARRGVEMFLHTHPEIARHVLSAKCADDGPGKPNPHMLEQVMAELGARAEETVMIGDTSFDIAMARAARVEPHGVAWGFHTVAEIQAADPHAIHADFDELKGGLDAFAPGGAG
ncbi:MAG: HAD-IA family hydrolase [Maricaulaceae bacterium]